MSGQGVRRRRPPSAYHDWISQEMKRLKASHPGLDHQAAFKIAASSEQRSQTLHCTARLPVSRWYQCRSLHAHLCGAFMQFNCKLQYAFLIQRQSAGQQTQHRARCFGLIVTISVCIQFQQRQEEQG